MTKKTSFRRPAVLRLRTRFLIPLLCAALPLALFATVVAVLLWNEKQSEIWEGQINGARALAIAAGRDIDHTRAHLEQLTESPLLSPDTMAAFQATCEQMLRIRPDWRHIILIDPTGNPVFRTGSKGHAPGRHASPTKHVAAVFATRLPVLSDVFTTSEGETLVSLVVPVLRGGEVLYALGAALRFDALDDLLKSHAGDTLVSLMDSRHQVVSRNVDPDRYRGRKAPAALAEALAEQPEWRLRTRTFENVLMDAAWVPVQGTSWKVVVGHTSAAAAPVTQQITLLMILGSLVFVGGVMIALRTGRRLHDEILAAAQHAAEAADGKPVDIPHTGTVELNLLGQVLFHAAAKIRQTEKERDELMVHAEQRRAAAEHANRTKDEFLAMLGHELRNPIGAISNSAELLRAPGLTQERERIARDIVVRQTRHLTRLIDDLLDVGRVVSGKIRLRTEAVDLAACVEGGTANAKAGGTGLDHVFRLHCTPVMVSADRARLEQVIANLVGNAVKYSPKGTEVSVETYRDGDHAVLRVKDQGIGLTKEQQQSIFELFYQGQSAGHRAGGLGIGLAIVKRIVELHEGSVEVESEGHGRGSTFTVRLPVLKEFVGTAAAAPKEAVCGNTLDVVVVEDNADARQSLEMLLEAEGHAVYTAVDGLQGLNQILDVVPDVALVDLDLPGMNGYEIARRVRRAGHGGMFLVAHSGYGQVHDVERAKEAGFDEHLVKPADMQKLRRLLTSVTRRDGKSTGEPLVGTARVISVRPLAPGDTTDTPGAQR